MKDWLRRVLKRLKEEATRPMTQHEYDYGMAICGGKRCPHCKKWL